MIAPAARVSSFLAGARDAGATDAELLDRYVAQRDGAAFAALVARHGPMVFGVCRRVLRDWHLAEDAFQATFLVLARRAEAVSPSGAVASWLHGVAFRAASAARRARLRRTNRERSPDALPDPAAPTAPDSELAAALDDEVRKLPGKYREVLVACDLEGRPRHSVAAALGIPEGTLSSRLTAARKMLAGRLAKRGVAPSSAALVALGGPGLAVCEVPRRVLASAAKLGCDAGGTVPAGIASLASKVSRTVSHRVLTPAAILALTACGAICATLSAGGAPPAPQPPVAAGTAAVRRAEPPKAAPKPAAKGPNKLIFVRHGQLTLVDPEGTNEKELPTGEGKHQPDDARFSPDGSILAVIGIDHDPQTGKTSHPLYLRKAHDKDAVTDLGVECQIVVWSADGTRLACTAIEDTPESPLDLDASHFIIDVKTKEKTALRLPSNHLISDWSADGKYFLTNSVEKEKTAERVVGRLHLMNRDGTERQALTDKSQGACLGRFSPDGTRVLFLTAPQPQKDQKEEPKDALAVLTIATGKTVKVADVPLNSLIEHFCWGPDGRRIAYAWRELHEGKPEEVNDKETVTTVVVCDPDGKNQKTVATATGKGQWLITISGLDWR